MNREKSYQTQNDDHTYFIDVKMDKGGNKYLKISEIRNSTDNGTARHQFMVFEEYIDKFAEIINNALTSLNDNPTLTTIAAGKREYTINFDTIDNKKCIIITEKSNRVGSEPFQDTVIIPEDIITNFSNSINLAFADFRENSNNKKNSNQFDNIGNLNNLSLSGLNSKLIIIEEKMENLQKIKNNIIEKIKKLEAEL
jgi:hypothetical protein